MLVFIKYFTVRSLKRVAGFYIFEFYLSASEVKTSVRLEKSSLNFRCQYLRCKLNSNLTQKNETYCSSSQYAHL